MLAAQYARGTRDPLARATSEEASRPLPGLELLRLLYDALDHLRPMLRLWMRRSGCLSSSTATPQVMPGSPNGAESASLEGVRPSPLLLPLPAWKRLCMDAQVKAELNSLQADIPELIRQLRVWVRRQGARVLDVFTSWDASEKLQLSEGELEQGLASLGFQAPPRLARKLFDEVSPNAPVKIAFAELQAWFMAGDSEEALLEIVSQGHVLGGCGSAGAQGSCARGPLA